MYYLRWGSCVGGESAKIKRENCFTLNKYTLDGSIDARKKCEKCKMGEKMCHYSILVTLFVCLNVGLCESISKSKIVI